METIAVLIIPVLFCAALLRLMLLPIRLAVKLLLHALAGLVCLWLLNSLSPFTGFALSVNSATALTAGVLGAPGILLLTALELL